MKMKSKQNWFIEMKEKAILIRFKGRQIERER